MADYVNKQKSNQPVGPYFLLIDDANHFLLIDDAGHRLLIQEENTGITYINRPKS